MKDGEVEDEMKAKSKQPRASRANASKETGACAFGASMSQGCADMGCGQLRSPWQLT